MDHDIEQACHDLLLRLAGRLPDGLLWRYRDWLGSGAVAAIARTLPKSLLKQGIDVDKTEYELMMACLVPYGADHHAVSSALGVDGARPSRYTFSGNAPERMNNVDSASEVMHAALRGRPDVGEVRQSWRYGGTGEEPEIKRLMLVTALTGLPRLAAELQRVLRALGDEEPGVEVIAPESEVGEYHRAALANSALLCAGAADARHRVVAA